MANVSVSSVLDRRCREQLLQACFVTLPGCLQAQARPLSAMEVSDDVQAQRTRKTLGRAMRRLRQANHVPPGVKRLLAALRVLQVSLECIRAVFLVMCRTLPGCRKAEDIEWGWLDGILHGFRLLNPSFDEDVHSASSTAGWQAHLYRAQYQLSQWVISQNALGLSPPISSTVQQYQRCWGMGPHREKVSQHLDLLQGKRYRKRQFHNWKRRWGFIWGRIPTKDHLREEQRKEKDHHWGESPSHPHRVQKKSLIGSNFWCSWWSHFLSPGRVQKEVQKVFSSLSALLWRILGGVFFGTVFGIQCVSKSSPRNVPEVGPLVRPRCKARGLSVLSPDISGRPDSSSSGSPT